MMKCLICGKEQFDCIHNGTRDILDIDVMKCTNCGMVQLDSIKYNTEQSYAEGGMLKNSYGAIGDKAEDITWNMWIKETEADDDRRYEALKEICAGKNVLEFGCGNGGFLRRIRNIAAGVTGVELMDEARRNIKEEGIEVYKALDVVDRKYDIVCMFMVLEHLNNPDKILGKIYNILSPGGILVCETPNSEDVLISKYKCAAFENFTYWSEHVFLFNSDTLGSLMSRNGFQTKWNTQIQRYPLANHLYWLSEGKPGGHMKWGEFAEHTLNNAYSEKLIELGVADTLWFIGMRK